MEPFNINTMDDIDIMLWHIGYYGDRFGDQKYEKLLNVVDNSEKLNRLFTRPLNMGHKLSAHEIMHTMNIMPFFIFSRPETHTLGGLMAINNYDGMTWPHFELTRLEIKTMYIEVLKENKFPYL